MRAFVCLSTLLSLPQPALADAFYCDGQVIAIGSTANTGRLWVSYGAIGMQAICEVDATFSGTHANACKAWLALFTAAQAQQKTIRLYYDSATGGNPTSCAGFQSWASTYIEMEIVDARRVGRAILKRGRTSDME